MRLPKMIQTRLEKKAAARKEKRMKAVPAGLTVEDAETTIRFMLTRANDGGTPNAITEFQWHSKGTSLNAITVAGIDPCTALACKEAGYEWAATSFNFEKNRETLDGQPQSQLYAVFFPIGSQEADRVQEFFGDVASEGQDGSMSLLEWLVLMQVVPSFCAQKALDEWTASWRLSKKAPEGTWALSVADTERMRGVIGAVEEPLLAGAGPQAGSVVVGQIKPVIYKEKPLRAGPGMFFPSPPSAPVLPQAVEESEEDFIEESTENDT